MPAHDGPFRMLIDPLGEVGLSIHGALAQGPLHGIPQVLILALARLRQRADRYDQFYHVRKTSEAAPRPGGESSAIDTYLISFRFQRKSRPCRAPPCRPHTSATGRAGRQRPGG